MLPVGKLCMYESLVDGTLDLADVADMVDALMVRADNDMIRAELERARRN